MNTQQMTENDSLVLGIDIGGTKTAAGVMSTSGELLTFASAPTPQDADAAELLAFVIALAESSCDGYRERLMAVGVGCGGPMNFPDGIVSPLFIPAWHNFPLRARLAAAFGLSITLDNDANAFALGEAHFGAGRGARAMLGLIVSTGVGGGIILDGRILHGATGNAGHIGHVIVSGEGPRCSCGAIGCLTAYASGTGLVARAEQGIQDGIATRLAALESGTLTGQAVVTAAGDGDAFAAMLMREAGIALARGIVAAANLLDLDRVVLGGGLIQAGDILFAPMWQEFRERARLPFTRDLDIRVTSTSQQAGVIGAAALALHVHGDRQI